jgi:hypothetical protein
MRTFCLCFRTYAWLLSVLHNNGNRLLMISLVTSCLRVRCKSQSIAEASAVLFSVLQCQRRTRYFALCCGLEFVMGDCHVQSLLDSCGVLSWSADWRVYSEGAKGRLIR